MLGAVPTRNILIGDFTLEYFHPFMVQKCSWKNTLSILLVFPRPDLCHNPCDKILSTLSIITTWDILRENRRLSHLQVRWVEICHYEVHSQLERISGVVFEVFLVFEFKNLTKNSTTY